MNAPLPAWKRFRLDVRGVNPLATSQAFWRGASQTATVGMFLIFLIAALSLAKTILLPVTLALVIGTVLAPLTKWASRYGIPAPVTAAFLVLGFIGMVSGGIMLSADPVREWIAQAPHIGEILKQKLRVFDNPLAALNELRQAITPSHSAQSGVITVDVNTSILEPVLSVLTPAIGELLLFFGTLFFFLSGHDSVQHYIIAVFRNRNSRLRALRIMRDFEHNLANYLAVVSAINFTIGIIVTIGAHFIGLPAPLAWGVLAFVLNFIPYIGPAVTIATLFGVGLISFPSLGQALIAPACYLGLVTLEGQVVTPSIIGRTLTLNPLMIFLAIAFWAWLWGPFGALLANPLLIVFLVALSHLFPKRVITLPG